MPAYAYEHIFIGNCSKDRMVVILNKFAAGCSLLVGLGYLIAKLLFGNTFSAGPAPMMIGIFFLGSVQLSWVSWANMLAQCSPMSRTARWLWKRNTSTLMTEW